MNPNLTFNLPNLIFWYLVFALILRMYFMLKSSDRYLIANRFVLSIGATLMFSAELFDLFTAWYGGYSYEQWAFYYRAIGPSYIFFYALLMGTLVLCLLNYTKVMRGKLILQAFIVFSFGVCAVWGEKLSVWSFGPFSGQRIFMGWHTDVLPISIFGSLILPLVWIVLVIVVVKLKWLPEFKFIPEANDTTYDSLIENE